MKYLLILAALSVTLQAATVTLEWDHRPPEEQIRQYRIYKLIDTNATILVTVPASTNRVTLTVEPGEHRFVARSVNDWGESINSNQATTPSLPKPPLITTNLVTVTAVRDVNGNKFLVSVQRQ